MVGICKCLQPNAFPREQQNMMMIVIIMVIVCPQDTWKSNLFSLEIDYLFPEHFSFTSLCFFLLSLVFIFACFVLVCLSFSLSSFISLFLYSISFLYVSFYLLCQACISLHFRFLRYLVAGETNLSSVHVSNLYTSVQSVFSLLHKGLALISYFKLLTYTCTYNQF